MRKSYLITLFAFLITITACQAKEMATTQNRDFAFEMPDGYTIVDVTEKSCSIVNEECIAIGGINLTGLSKKDLEDENCTAIPVYLNQMVYGCEFFSWMGNDPNRPVRYVFQELSSDSGHKKEYYRVLFVKNGAVYDMWFDLNLIDKETASALFDPIVEVK